MIVRWFPARRPAWRRWLWLVLFANELRGLAVTAPAWMWLRHGGWL